MTNGIGTRAKVKGSTGLMPVTIVERSPILAGYELQEEIQVATEVEHAGESAAENGIFDSLRLPTMSNPSFVRLNCGLRPRYLLDKARIETRTRIWFHP
jgi:hypothetical protein